MKNQKSKISIAIGAAVIPLALSMPLTAFAKEAVKTSSTTVSKAKAANNKDVTTNNPKNGS